MSKKTVIPFVIGMVAGIVFAPQITKLPLVNKIPTL